MTDKFINTTAVLYAIGIFFSVPIIIVMLQLLCIFFLCFWPFAIIIGYFQRKEELELNDND
jgi:Sec-independent protein secretion pathway component TatC